MRLYTLIFSLLALACGGGDTTAPRSVGGTITSVLPPGPAFVSRSIVYNGVTYPYQVFIPAGFDRSKKWPVVMSIHGGNEVGTDNQKQLTTGLAIEVKGHQSTWPAVTIFPQVPPTATRPMFAQMAPVMLDSVMDEFSGDATRLYLNGQSLGGELAYAIAYNQPTRFAAIVTVGAPLLPPCAESTPGCPSQTAFVGLAANALKRVPIWTFQGTADSLVSIYVIRQIKFAFDQAHANFKLTEVPNGQHNVWDQEYRDQSLFTWLFAQHL